MTKYLAIDYGLKRTGIAVSDADGLMAFPRKTLLMRTRDAFFAELLTLIDAENPDALLVGLPTLLDGQEGLMTRQAKNFMTRLSHRTTLPIYWMPEILSSFLAEQDLRQAGHKERDLRAVIDQQAAVRILESFLNVPEEKRISYARESLT